jgi:hypothetical protein
MGDERARDIQITGESSRFRPSSSPLSNSSSHLLFTAFLVRLAGGGVVSDGEGADRGAGGVDGLATGVDGWGDDNVANCTFVAAKGAGLSLNGDSSWRQKGQQLCQMKRGGRLLQYPAAQKSV